MKKTIIISFMVCVLVLCFVGCAENRTYDTEYPEYDADATVVPEQTQFGEDQSTIDYNGRTNYNVDTQRVRNENTVSTDMRRAGNNAKNICTRLDGMMGVDDVSCVISGDDCFVSVQMDERASDFQKRCVLRDCFMVCKNTNQTLENVYLNFDSDLHGQIKGYMNQMSTSDSTFAPQITQIKSSMQDVTIR